MHSHRRQLIQSLDLLAFTIFVYLWLLDKSTLSLFLRCFLQIQFCNPIQVHPIGWSPFKLRTLLCFQVGFNLIMILIHLSSSGIVSSSKGTNNLMEKGSAGQHTLIIDFIGQDYEPSKFHLVLIDLFLTMIQSVLLIVSYENGWDELEPSKQGQLSFLDDSDSDSEFGDAQDPGGQGWDLGIYPTERIHLFPSILLFFPFLLLFLFHNNFPLALCRRSRLGRGGKPLPGSDVW
ncbi:hypothetical protein IE53DRAFT_410687 [Violaceomyces palustris]|uniref:Uncharacterized protein n=1 Tax=Violaceomyces palustris TaxID=1673888 RepID=A0ACD0NXW7_9BASI|nr:hypothetical protein IE53DRAFT_410687 [Violaceomyces palustris]